MLWMAYGTFVGRAASACKPTNGQKKLSCLRKKGKNERQREREENVRNAKCKPLISAALSPSLTWDNKRESESSGSATTIAAINRRNADGFYLNWIWTWDGLTSIAVIIFPAIHVGRSGDILQSESYFSKWSPLVFLSNCAVLLKITRIFQLDYDKG